MIKIPDGMVGKRLSTFTREEFELAYRRAMEAGGHSCDAFDIAFCWADFRTNPENYRWIMPNAPA